MAPGNQNENNLQHKTVEEKVEVPAQTQRPASFLTVVMHVFWIAALFMVFKGISIYVEDRREDAAATASETQLASPTQVESDSTKLQPMPTNASSRTAAMDVPVATGFTASTADVVPTISGKAVTKATTCSELKDVLEYWVEIAQKPHSKARGKWLEDRIQDVQVQKEALNCKW